MQKDIDVFAKVTKLTIIASPDRLTYKMFLQLNL